MRIISALMCMSLLKLSAHTLLSQIYLVLMIPGGSTSDKARASLVLPPGIYFFTSYRYALQCEDNAHRG